MNAFQKAMKREEDCEVFTNRTLELTREIAAILTKSDDNRMVGAIISTLTAAWLSGYDPDTRFEALNLHVKTVIGSLQIQQVMQK